MRRPVCPPGVAAYWIEADLIANPRHPLERELASCQDAAARYARQRIAAEEAGMARHADHLGRLLQDQLAQLGRIQAALHRLRRPWPYRPAAHQPVVLFVPTPGRRHAPAVPRAVPVLASAKPEAEADRRRRPFAAVLALGERASPVAREQPSAA